MVSELQRRPYDPLSPASTEFDRDALEFDVYAHELEASLQVRAAWKQFGSGKELESRAGWPAMSCTCGCNAPESARA